MIRASEIDAVVFDMGGVFTIQSPELINRIVRGAGVELALDDGGARLAHYTAVRAITELLAHIEVVEAEGTFWDVFDTAFFASAGLFGAELESAKQARLAERDSGVGKVWTHLLDENLEAFRRIAADRPVAIVTNNVGTAVEQCVEAGLCQIGPGPLTEVVAIVDSAIVGVAKPDPRIFAPALEALATEPARTLYVGDTVHADVHGAQRAGMAVVQLDPLDLHADHSHWRLPDVAALADHLA